MKKVYSIILAVIMIGMLFILTGCAEKVDNSISNTNITAKKV